MGHLIQTGPKHRRLICSVSFFRISVTRSGKDRELLIVGEKCESRARDSHVFATWWNLIFVGNKQMKPTPIGGRENRSLAVSRLCFPLFLKHRYVSTMFTTYLFILFFNQWSLSANSPFSPNYIKLFLSLGIYSKLHYCYKFSLFPLNKISIHTYLLPCDLPSSW